MLCPSEFHRATLVDHAGGRRMLVVVYHPRLPIRCFMNHVERKARNEIYKEESLHVVLSYFGDVSYWMEVFLRLILSHKVNQYINQENGFEREIIDDPFAVLLKSMFTVQQLLQAVAVRKAESAIIAALNDGYERQKGYEEFPSVQLRAFHMYDKSLYETAIFIIQFIMIVGIFSVVLFF